MQDDLCLGGLLQQGRGAADAPCLRSVGGFAEQLLASTAGLQQRDIGELKKSDPKKTHQIDRLACHLELACLGRAACLNLSRIGLLLGKRHTVQVPRIGADGYQAAHFLKRLGKGARAMTFGGSLELLEVSDAGVLPSAVGRLDERPRHNGRYGCVDLVENFGLDLGECTAAQS